MILVGNKCDLKHLPNAVSFAEAKQVNNNVIAACVWTQRALIGWPYEPIITFPIGNTASS